MTMFNVHCEGLETGARFTRTLEAETPKEAAEAVKELCPQPVKILKTKVAKDIAK